MIIKGLNLVSGCAYGSNLPCGGVREKVERLPEIG